MTNETDVVCGHVVIERNTAIAAAMIIGCCLNILPCVDFASVTTAAELVHAVQDQHLSMGDADFSTSETPSSTREVYRLDSAFERRRDPLPPDCRRGHPYPEADSLVQEW
ncbi:uncharacterized protein BJX67DRAFT_378697 [Aspergillus lucknowensis]|uniref:Uncharacterized protein n=1 Tax=Aspergillus lucknowensis TaxID=176173 RepID=A0ABR4M042_9EURO